MTPPHARIGIFDSGMGGLSVAHAVHTFLPSHDILYVADTAYCPYGPRLVEEVRERSRACTAWLQAQGAQLIVVACNTASSASLEMLREAFPLPIVGMEPGIKPAIAATRSGHVGVLATSGTLSGHRFANLMQRFAENVHVRTVPCHALVERVEQGIIDDEEIRAVLQTCLDSFREETIDTIVLGCTHFNFIASALSHLVGDQVTIIDTAPAVARQVARVVETQHIPPGTGEVLCATTGDAAVVAPVIAHLWGTPLPVTTISLSPVVQ